MSSLQYFLPKHVFLCFTGDHCVFLDLKRDEYLSISRMETAGLGTVVRGWPGGQDIAEERSALTAHDIAKIVNAMVEVGLLTQSPNEGKEAACTRVASPSAVLVAAESAAEVQRLIRAPDVVNFFVASGRAAMALRWRPLEYIIQAVACRKRRYGAPSRQLDPEVAQEHVMAFNALRPYFPRKHLCLFDSLALIEFLARYGLFPTWVFGVQVEPFHAHCWVQDEGIVFNDTIEYVSAFAPIMSV